MNTPGKKMLLDRNGLFHPDANRMRTEATMHAEMKRIINMDRIENKILYEMFAESKGTVFLLFLPFGGGGGCCCC